MTTFLRSSDANWNSAFSTSRFMSFFLFSSSSQASSRAPSASSSLSRASSIFSVLSSNSFNFFSFTGIVKGSLSFLEFVPCFLYFLCTLFQFLQLFLVHSQTLLSSLVVLGQQFETTFCISQVVLGFLNLTLSIDKLILCTEHALIMLIDQVSDLCQAGLEVAQHLSFEGVRHGCCCLWCRLSLL